MEVVKVQLTEVDDLPDSCRSIAYYFTFVLFYIFITQNRLLRIVIKLRTIRKSILFYDN